MQCHIKVCNIYGSLSSWYHFTLVPDRCWFTTDNMPWYYLLPCYMRCTLTCFAIHLHFPEPKPLSIGTQVYRHMSSPYRSWCAGHLACNYTFFMRFCLKKLFDMFIYVLKQMCVMIDIIKINYFTGIATRLPQCIALAIVWLYQLPSFWMTRVFVTSDKRGGILGWMLVCRWCYITHSYKKVCWKATQWLINCLY